MRFDSIPLERGMPFTQLADVLNGFSDVAFLVDRSRKLRACNEAARAIFGDVREGSDFVHVIRRPEVLRSVDAALRGQIKAQVVVELEGALRGTFRVTAARVGDLGAVVSFADISHIREAEQMRSDFVANVSHELRSPLTALTGFIETLQGPAKTDMAAHARFLGLMEREAGRMNRLIADLLSLSRVEESARDRPTDIVDLNDIMNRVVATLSQQADRAGLRLDWTPCAAPCLAPGDEDQLIQVAHNLVDNAVKYGASGEAVTLSLSGPAPAAGMPRDAYTIEVRDDGPGIPREHLPRLTERFYRVDTGRSRDKGGTGLGLAIVKHIVQRHRGRLIIDSSPGEGVAIRVVLPVIDSSGITD